MYNGSRPTVDELPTSGQLLRSTLLALVVAIAILLTIVLPAEYAMDPTGAGRVLGLLEMGELKAQLAEEAANDAAQAQAAPAAAARQSAGTSGDGTAIAVQPDNARMQATDRWHDEMQLVLAPGEGGEIKLVMEAGARAEFSWSAQGGVVNFDTHGDGGGQSISYEKGRGVPADEGVLEAAFDGNHGWFWRNRGESSVTVILRARGQYSEMKRVI